MLQTHTYVCMYTEPMLTANKSKDGFIMDRIEFIEANRNVRIEKKRKMHKHLTFDTK